MSNDFIQDMEINKKENKFPYCVVFTYLPFVSTFIPIIGHIGICTSEGIVHDFSGSYTISVDDMGFGDPMKYWKLDKNKLPLSITDAVLKKS
ncbi:transmembrane protein TMEM222 [Plasmodium yoelii yoelii]|uniref:Transmembrane protein TMEM222 n=1 Tax=Plasmodium yoelii yoelii TaxID=73239 RepID=A0AAF0B6N1_PLAYO|nr:transmembrane protein TMEM222 [Plasmodium yoelii yoelii]